MSLASMLGLIKNDLEEAFSRQPFDPAKGRQRLLDGIERSRQQFAQTEPVRGRKWFTVNNNVVAFSPTQGNSGPLTINGLTTNFIPVEAFGQFLDNMQAAVDAGEFDAEIERAAKHNGMVSGTADVAIPSGKAKQAKSQPTSAPVRRADWDTLSRGEKQRVSALYRYGKNPDGTMIAEVGERPNAPIIAK